MDRNGLKKCIHVKTLFLLTWLLIALHANTIFAYSPPIGIPDPPFGIENTTPSRPDSWTNEIPGYYYVNYSIGSDSNTYGSPVNPRQTLPSPIPAGSYVEIEGTYSHTIGGATRIYADGNLNNPVYLVGKNIENSIFNKLTTFNGQYLIIENITFNNILSARIGYNSEYISIRKCDITYSLSSSGSLIGLSGNTTYSPNHIVVFKNTIHDTRDDWNMGTDDVDGHGLKPHNYAHDLWILENTFYNVGGNAIQVGDQTSDQDTVYNIFIGRNHIYNTRQTGIGIKKASDVIVSENKIHSMHEIQSGNPTAGVAYQYAPRRVWVIYNEIFDADYGIKSGSDTSPVEDYVYIIGNLIHDISYASSHSGGGWFQGAGVMLNGSSHIYVINNTMYNLEDGIESSLKSGKSIFIENNIISNITNRNHLYIESSYCDITFRNNICYQPDGTERLRYGSSGDVSLEQFTIDENCSSSNPLFVNSDNNNFNISDGSVAYNNGLSPSQLTSNVYNTFLNTYGISINFDIAGNPRPTDKNWSIGAYELIDGTSTLPISIDPPKNVIVESSSTN